jgi:hypothetical protein
MRQVHRVIKYIGKTSQYAAEIMAVTDSVLWYVLGKPQQTVKETASFEDGKMQWIKAM